MDKINAFILRRPAISALIPIAGTFIIMAIVAGPLEALRALALAAVVLIAATVVASVIGRKALDDDDDDWWSPGGPSPV